MPASCAGGRLRFCSTISDGAWPGRPLYERKSRSVKCWFCENIARGTCAACGRALCHQHAHIHDEMTLAKSDTSTGHSSYYNVYGALKCSDCRLEWKSFQPGR
jgi:hypothetical protein